MNDNVSVRQYVYSHR